jgi:uncharacterized protein YaaN involved in tellurite resistance
MEKNIDDLTLLKQDDIHTDTAADTNDLSKEDLLRAQELSEKINLTDNTEILQYGVEAQKKVSEFSENVLKRIRTKETGVVGDMLISLTTELKDFTKDNGDKKGFLRFIKKYNKLDNIKVRYNTVKVNLDKIIESLDNHRIELLRDITMLDKMYEENLGYFRNLSLYIIAGKKRLERAKQGELKALKDKADQSTNIEDSQKLKDFQDLCIRFEKKIFDLELTRNICIQMGPQIRLVQNNDIILADKIQSSIINTIPLWKNQMVLNLGIEHSKRALNAQKMVTDMTNQLLKTNADLLKTNTLETAK